LEFARTATILATSLTAAEPAPAPAGVAATTSPILQELRSFRRNGHGPLSRGPSDDENTQFITYFSRGRGFRTGYLSLTRGDGGQNELGRDFDAKLGVIRTQELLAPGGSTRPAVFHAARSTSLLEKSEETLRFWDRDQVLADVVRVIRQFRPDVIVTRFPIPPGSGGHGHHTASAILAVEAFKLAGDPKAYPEQLTQGLTVWQPKRVVWNDFGQGRGGNGLTGPSVQLDIGGNDPVTGEPFGTIANRSAACTDAGAGGIFRSRRRRSQHAELHAAGGRTFRCARCFARRRPDGPRAPSRAQQGASNGAPDLMDGVDLTWKRVEGGGRVGLLVEDAIAQFKPDDPPRQCRHCSRSATRLSHCPPTPS